MNTHHLESDATWLAGLLDAFGHFGVKDNRPFVRLKTTDLGRIEAVAAILGMSKKPYGPFDNQGSSKQVQYALEITGESLAFLENLVVSRMRTARRELFQQLREHTRRLRNRLTREGGSE